MIFSCKNLSDTSAIREWLNRNVTCTWLNWFLGKVCGHEKAEKIDLTLEECKKRWRQIADGNVLHKSYEVILENGQT